MPFRTDSLTRSSWIDERGASICVTPRTELFVPFPKIPPPKKAEKQPEYIGRASTPCATSAVRHVATAKPAAIAATITSAGNILCRRNPNAAAARIAAVMTVTDRTGS